MRMNERQNEIEREQDGEREIDRESACMNWRERKMNI